MTYVIAQSGHFVWLDIGCPLLWCTAFVPCTSTISCFLQLHLSPFEDVLSFLKSAFLLVLLQLLIVINVLCNSVCFRRLSLLLCRLFVVVPLARYVDALGLL